MGKEFRIYKPKNSKDGTASKIQISNGKKKFETLSLWWEIAQQGPDKDGNSSFHWDKKDGKQVSMKLGLPDVGELLTVLGGIKPHVGGLDKQGKPFGLFHKNDKGNTVLKFSQFPDQEGKPSNGYYVELSSQRDGKVLKLGHSVTFGEGTVLKLILEEFVRNSFLFEQKPPPLEDGESSQ